MKAFENQVNKEKTLHESFYIILGSDHQAPGK